MRHRQSATLHVGGDPIAVAQALSRMWDEIGKAMDVYATQVLLVQQWRFMQYQRDDIKTEAAQRFAELIDEDTRQSSLKTRKRAGEQTPLQDTLLSSQ